jgi:transcriptional regulator with XRE-family HTH domain
MHMRMICVMNAVAYIRTKVFKLEQAPFAGIAGVSQPTVSRWEQSEIENSEPNRRAMALIREEAIRRGLPWSDSWFFQTFPDEPTSQRDSAA